VICSLQDEDSWLDALDEPYGTLCWDALRERAAGVSAFTAVSRFYAQSMSERLALDSARVHVVYPGIELESYAPSSLPFDPPVIGYLARMTASLGLERLADAYLVLRRRPNHRGLRLRIAGGMTADDKTFVARTRRKLRAAGVLGSVDFVPRFERPARVEFLRTLTVLSVPQSAPEAFGLYILEALAAGVPVVQPAIGGFEEVIKATGGGVLFEPNTPEKLAETLGGLLEDPERVRRLGEEGRRNVGERFTLAQAARNMLEVYAGDPG
jgi:glycosyltransferase involved in cell wall biosynthesis